MKRRRPTIFLIDFLGVGHAGNPHPALNADEPTLTALSTLIIETNANGGSLVSCTRSPPKPLAAFGWARCGRRRAESASCSALVDGVLIGAVTMLLDFPQNQPHRAEMAKMMTRVAFRGQESAAG